METERSKTLADIVGEEMLDVSSETVITNVDLGHAAATPELEEALDKAETTKERDALLTDAFS